MHCVIPAHPKDYQVMGACVESCLRHLDVQRVHVVSQTRPGCLPEDPRVFWVPDDRRTFPFDLESVQELLPQEYRQQAGWYLQQLIKLYAGTHIPGCSPRYMVLDSDCVIFKPFPLETPEGLAVMSTSDEYHEPYFVAMARLHPSLKRCSERSWICHYSVFDTAVCQGLISMVEVLRKGSGLAFWQLFVSLSADHRNGQSEYEMYGTYKHGVLGLKSKVVSHRFENRPDFSRRAEYDGDACYVAYHEYAGRL